MKYSALLILLIFLYTSLPASAQLINFKEAQTLAQDQNKNILMVFSGSDWCKPCMQFKNDILESEKFAEYQINNLVHLELDFPYRKKNQLNVEQTKHNEELAEKYNSKGEFPTILITSSEGEVITKLQYAKGMKAEDFITQIRSAIE